MEGDPLLTVVLGLLIIELLHHYTKLRKMNENSLECVVVIRIYEFI